MDLRGHRPRQLRWSATDRECGEPLPGDDLIADHDLAATRAITIRAPASQVWPWIVQLGQGRGGFYSYDFLENLIGCDIHSAGRIVPEWQDLKPGDQVKLAPQAGLAVAHLEPGRSVVLRGGVPTGNSAPPYDFTWAFVVKDEQRGGVRADAVPGEQAGGAGGDAGDDELVGALELAAEELGATAQLAQRDPGGVADDVAGAGPQRRQIGDQGRRGVPGEPFPQVIRAGQDEGAGLVDRPGTLTCGAALGDHQGADRLDLPVPALRRAAGPAGLGGTGSADRVQRVGFALAVDE